MEKSIRYNEGKPKWSLVDFKSLEPLVRVMEYGEMKYSRDNWKIGLNPTETLDSLARHLFKLMSGEEVDSESGLPHTGHILANIMFYIYHHEKNKLVNK